VVLESGWREKADPTDRVGTTGRTGSSFYHDIHYAYTVEAVEYTSDKVGVWYIGGKGIGMSQAREIVRRYNVGDEVKVYFNPRDHSDALLEPGAVSYWWLFFPCALGLLFMAGGIRQLIQAGPIAFGGE
jgi:hypothetical protein